MSGQNGIIGTSMYYRLLNDIYDSSFHCHHCKNGNNKTYKQTKDKH